MQQNIQDYDDIYAGLNEQILKNLYIRFYTMEEYFQFTLAQDHMAAISTQLQDQSTGPQSKKIIPVSLIYNRIIQQCISDLYILNKLIFSKAKTVNSILDNGRNIANKKSKIWKEFINQPGMEKVKAAYKLMKNSKRNIIKYSVLSISNLLLKLGINMSKVSIFPIQRFLNFQCLNIPSLSVAFLQYMQYNLYKSKNITDQTLQGNFIKQLPKITFIKFSKYKNNSDVELLQTSQDAFISKQTKQAHKNLQFIDIHQLSQDPIMPNFKRKTNYPYFYSVDLQKLANGVLRAPYTFEILEIMRQLIFPLVKDFKPDLIVYMESFGNGQIVMDDQIRGLMICQMAQQTTCNKMYIMKQFGPDKYSYEGYRNLISKPEQNMMSEQHIKKGQIISQQFNNIFQAEQKSFANKYSNKFLKQEQKNTLQKVKKVFINQMCYISLALIQKTSFDNVLQKSHQHFYQQQLLKGLSDELEQKMQKIEKNEQLLINTLKFKKQSVKMMLEVLKYRNEQKNSNSSGLKIINLVHKQTQFKSFYNILTQQEQQLSSYEEFQDGSSKITHHSFNQQDNFIVKYYEQQKRLLAIIIKNAITVSDNQQMMKQTCPNGQVKRYVRLIVLSKKLENKSNYMTLEKVLQFPAEQNLLIDPIYICSSDFLYRAFGKFKFSNKLGATREGYNCAIHRLQINPLIGQEWQLIGTEGIPVKSDGKQEKKIEIERKIHGYGIHDVDNKSIVLMGGYIDSANEEKISKNIYIIRNPDIMTGKQPPKIHILGKTNKIVYNTSSQKIKDIFLYPFVFGIPFYVNLAQGQKSIASVINSNGYYLNLNLTNKIFLSLIKLSAIMTYNGINVQNKLKLEKNCEQAATSIFLSEILNKCIVCYPHQINVKGPICCVQTLEEGNIIMYANPSTKQISVVSKEIFDDSQARKIQFI